MPRHQDPFDTHLLRVLLCLLEERSVSRAAVRMNLSQPAMSAALKRLRDIFCDPLLIKDKQRMVPTERAEQIGRTVRGLLGELDGLLLPPDTFDAATSRQVFRIGTPDYLAPSFMAAVAGYLRTHAPGVRLVLQPLGPDYDYEHALAQGELDVVIGNWPHPPEHLRMGMLIDDEVVCLLDAAQPLAAPGALSLARYLSAAHIVPLPYSVAQRGVVESHLAQLHLARQAAVTLPYFGLAPWLLVGTDLVFTTARHFAEHAARQVAGAGGGAALTIVTPPLDFPPMRFYQLWHTRSHTAAPQAWLRSLITAVARTQATTRQLGAPPLASLAPHDSAPTVPWPQMTGDPHAP